jgi:hypothetical protein
VIPAQAVRRLLLGLESLAPEVSAERLVEFLVAELVSHRE